MSKVKGKIPLINMSDFINGSRQQRLDISQEFGRALETYGFVAIDQLGIDLNLVEDAYKAAEKYFLLPQEIKMSHESGDGIRGFFPMGKEHAKDCSLEDLKEFYQTMGHSNSDKLWPNDILPAFREKMLQLYDHIQTHIKHCLTATAIYLGYPENEETIIADMIAENHSAMRIIHYPPVPQSLAKAGAIRAASHEDIAMMTLIPKTTSAGLQVLPEGHSEWIDVSVPPTAAIINSGDTLNRITNYRIPSSTHRVINPPDDDGSRRFSVPFFSHPAHATPLTPLSRCPPLPGKDPVKTIPFGDFLTERLVAIGIAVDDTWAEGAD